MKYLTFLCFLIPVLCLSQNAAAIKLIKGRQHVANHSQKEYQFVIEGNKSHGHVPLVVNDIFSWDTLSKKQLGKEYILSFKNESKFPLYVLDISAQSQNFDVKNIGKAMILPDSMVRLSFRCDTAGFGDFYGNIAIYYNRNNANEYYDMWMYGFQPYKNKGVTQLNTALRRLETKKLIVLDDKLTSTNKCKIKVIEKDTSYYPKLIQENGEWGCVLNLRNDSYTAVEIIDETGKVKGKGFLENDFMKHNIFLHLRPEPPKIHTYNRGPVAYKALDSLYFVSWTGDFKQDEVITYLKSKGIDARNSSLVSFVMKDKAKVLALQKELTLSKYKIAILPAISYSEVNEFGWGGACRFYTNNFEISFFNHVSNERIEQIFKQHGITNYYVREETNQEKKYTFILPVIVDLKYMTLLDKLWQLSEVTSIEQEDRGIDGID